MKTYTKTHFKCGDMHSPTLTDFPVPGVEKDVFIGSIELVHTQGEKHAEIRLGFYEYVPQGLPGSSPGFYGIGEEYTLKIKNHVSQRLKYEGVDMRYGQSWIHFELEIKKSFSSTVTGLCTELARLVRRNGRMDNWLYHPEMGPVTMVRMKKPSYLDITYADFILLKAGLRTTRDIFGLYGGWALA